MENKEVLQKIEQYKDLVANFEATTQQLKDTTAKVDGVHDKIVEETKNAAADAAQKISDELKADFKAQTEDYVEKSKARQKAIDDLDAKVQKLEQKGNQTIPGGRNLSAKIHNLFDDESTRKRLLAKERNLEVNLEFKVVGDIGSTSFTGATSSSAADFQDISGVVYDPPRPIRVRNLVTVTPTIKDSIKWIHEAATPGEGGATMVAMAGTKPQFDRDLVRKNYAVEKIATYARFPEEFADDIAWMQSYLGQRGQDLVMDEEDTQILTGNGTPPNLHGLQTDGAAYVDTLADASTQEWDVLGVAVTQVRNNNYNPTAVLVHPSRLLTMLALKDTSDRYLLPGIFTGQSPAILGVPVIANTAIDSNAFVVGDFRGGCTLFQRGGITVRFYDQDQDNAITNMITVVIEERLAFVTERPNAFAVSSDFDASITAGLT